MIRVDDKRGRRACKRALKNHKLSELQMMLFDPQTKKKPNKNVLVRACDDCGRELKHVNVSWRIRRTMNCRLIGCTVLKHSDMYLHGLHVTKPEKYMVPSFDPSYGSVIAGEAGVPC